MGIRFLDDIDVDKDKDVNVDVVVVAISRRLCRSLFNLKFELKYRWLPDVDDKDDDEARPKFDDAGPATWYRCSVETRWFPKLVEDPESVFLKANSDVVRVLVGVVTGDDSDGGDRNDDDDFDDSGDECVDVKKDLMLIFRLIGELDPVEWLRRNGGV